MSEDNPTYAVGRPLASVSDMPEGWKDVIIALYSNGASDVEVKAWIYKMRGSFSNDLWERWLKDEKEFSETIKIGRIIAEAWFNKVGRENLSNPKFSHVGWYMQMKNRFGWKDKTDITTNGESLNTPPDLTQLSDDELQTLIQLQEKLKR